MLRSPSTRLVNTRSSWPIISPRGRRNCCVWHRHRRSPCRGSWPWATSSCSRRSISRRGGEGVADDAMLGSLIEEFRKHADECRRHAEQCIDSGDRERWLKIAEQWRKIVEAGGSDRLWPSHHKER